MSVLLQVLQVLQGWVMYKDSAESESKGQATSFKCTEGKADSFKCTGIRLASSSCSMTSSSMDTVVISREL